MKIEFREDCTLSSLLETAMYLVKTPVQPLIDRSHLRLAIFRSASGAWAGTMYYDNEPIANVGGCGSPDEVEQAAFSADLFADEVEFSA